MILRKRKDDESLDDTEEQIEAALQELLDAEAAADEACEEDDSAEDDYDDRDDGDDEGEESDEGEQDCTAGLDDEERNKRHEDTSAVNAPNNRKRRKHSDGSYAIDSKIGRVDQSPNTRPSNFSRVDTTLPSELIQQHFPLFQE